MYTLTLMNSQYFKETNLRFLQITRTKIQHDENKKIHTKIYLKNLYPIYF